MSNWPKMHKEWLTVYYSQEQSDQGLHCLLTTFLSQFFYILSQLEVNTVKIWTSKNLL